MANLADRKASIALMALLENVSESEMRAIGIEALRRSRRQELKNTQSAREPVYAYPGTVFAMNALGNHIVDQLVVRKNVARPNLNVQESFIDDAALFCSWMSPFVEFIWWLARAGLAVEHDYGYKAFFDDNGHPYPKRNNEAPLHVFPTSMRLTSRGVRLVDGSDDDPLLPGFLDRIKQRCPDLPDGVIALLVDARACLDRRLNRPAVVLMGVAYELAIEEVATGLVTKNYISKDALKEMAGPRLRRVRDFLASSHAEQLIPDKEERRTIGYAYSFAEDLRQRRNDAAHTRPAFDFEHGYECEEYIVSAGRQLPALWRLHELASA